MITTYPLPTSSEADYLYNTMICASDHLTNRDNEWLMEYELAHPELIEEYRVIYSNSNNPPF